MNCETDKDAPLTWWEVALGILGMASPVIGIVTVGLMCGGCFNICGHAMDERKYEPYDATVAMSHGIVEAFAEKPEWHYGSHGEAGIAHAWSLVLLPVWVICLPVEAVADTITLPYDAATGK